MTRIEDLRNLLCRLRDQAASEKRELLAYRIGLALDEADAEIVRRQQSSTWPKPH